MSAILAQEGNNTATADLVENAGKQIVAVTGNVLGGVVYTHTENATAVSNKKLALLMCQCLIINAIQTLFKPGRAIALYCIVRS